jgi:streptogramin lyase
MDDLDGRGWVSFGAGSQGSGRNQFDNPEGIFVDPSGHIYVADFNRILRIDDMTGRGWTTLELRDPRYASANAGHLAPGQIAVDRAGRIDAIVSQTRLVRVDNMTGAGLKVSYFGGGNPGQHGMHYAPSLSGIAVDSAGRIYVVDSSNSQIVRIDDVGGTGWTAFGTYGSGHGQFSSPSSIFVDSAGKIYVADKENHRIVRINDMAGSGWTTLERF